MGWGISIDQDADGRVYCSDANFETNAYDYQGFPPSSYDFIYEQVEGCHREIDMARDEMGVSAAAEQCYDAFNGAKRAWRGLGEDERTRIHREYVSDLKKQIRECKVDRKRQKEKIDQITFFESKSGPKLDKLNAEIAALEARLEAKRTEYKKHHEPLAILESELAIINEPARRKRELQKRLDLEEAEWEA